MLPTCSPAASPSAPPIKTTRIIHMAGDLGSRQIRMVLQKEKLIIITSVGMITVMRMIVLIITLVINVRIYE